MKNIYYADFETTVYEGQDNTEVWASAVLDDFSEEPRIFTSIDETWRYIKSLSSPLIYYHNLKFDGSFWLNYLLSNGYQMCLPDVKTSEMQPKHIKALITGMGQWYSIVIKINKKQHVEMRDSYKLLPFSIDTIGKTFDTHERKLSIEYAGARKAGSDITDEEKKYISADVLVLREALHSLFDEGHKKLTIGSCCMAEFKKNAMFKWDVYFPDLTKIKSIDPAFNNIDAYCRYGYHGGWCYVDPDNAGKEQGKGFTLDVNSLYPSMMHSQSGNVFPVGVPKQYMGYIERKKDRYYVYHVNFRFNIRPHKLPCIQVKKNLIYPPTKWLTTSNIIIDGVSYDYYIIDDRRYEATVDAVVTQTDLDMIFDHYDVYDYECISSLEFRAVNGIFDSYIDHFMTIKENSTGAKRTLAKLFLNNLYGKLATSPNVIWKLPYSEEEQLKFTIEKGPCKKVVYIAAGMAITSYARAYTINAAQANIAVFRYADTDSIHCIGDVADVKGVEIHPSKLGCWKHESTWDKAIFSRQKTYIEHVIDGIPHNDIKCAGMSQRCKILFDMSLGTKYNIQLTDDEKAFVSKPRTYSDFVKGLKIPSKLVARQIKGGVVLQSTTFEMR